MSLNEGGRSGIVEDEEEVELSGVAAGPAVGIDEDISMEIMQTTAAPDILKVWPWVNQVCSRSATCWQHTS